MAKILIVLVIAFSFEALGVITPKTGINQITARYNQRAAATPRWQNTLRLVGDWFTTRSVLLGLLLETIFFVLLQYLLAQQDVSFIWPLTSLSFVMTTLAAQFILGEKVDALRWGGVGLIMLGAALISLGEHGREQAAKQTIPPAATAQPLPATLPGEPSRSK
jgi:drug/metabolite transporter (DMT)-like permease